MLGDSFRGPVGPRTLQGKPECRSRRDETDVGLRRHRLGQYLSNACGVVNVEVLRKSCILLEHRTLDYRLNEPEDPSLRRLDARNGVRRQDQLKVIFGDL